MVATFWIFFARSAKRSADSVSSTLTAAGEALHNITVTEFPPNESCSSRVSFESRYGTCRVFFSLSAEITFPSAESETLMLAPSFSRSPVAPVPFCRSDPA
eukprot:1413713-Rhodomonas_salina.1